MQISPRFRREPFLRSLTWQSNPEWPRAGGSIRYDAGSTRDLDRRQSPPSFELAASSR